MSREGSLELRKEDKTGTSLSFGLVRPIIGRYLSKEMFTPPRSVNMTKSQAAVSAVGAGVRLAANVVGVATGSTDSEKISEFVTKLGETIYKVGAADMLSKNVKWQPLFKNMQVYLVRCRDIISMLNSLIDEVLRQQRKSEMRLRRTKRRLRSKFAHPELTYNKFAETRSQTEVISRNLLNEIMDVSANIAIGFYSIYVSARQSVALLPSQSHARPLPQKLYNLFTDKTLKDLKKSGEQLPRGNDGETELVSEMLQIVAQGSPGTVWLRVLSGRNLKKAAATLGNKEYIDKITKSFHSFEDDLRDDIQNVELALSAYRLRIQAEDSIYLAISLNGGGKYVSRVEDGADFNYMWDSDLGDEKETYDLDDSGGDQNYVTSVDSYGKKRTYI